MPGYMKAKANTQMTAALNTLLADTFILYFKTHTCHWNVEGVNFGPLHDLFGAQYKELWDATDDIAERLRALGAYGPVSFEAMAKHAHLKDAGTKVLKAPEMIKDLLRAHESMIETLVSLIELADEHDDDVTEDMMTQRLAAHEKMAWMLRAHLK